MATESTSKQTFNVRNLQTNCVTLYPTKAHIVRTINGISLKPGANQIVIEGLTPTIDEHSIKVEGTGSATITDLSVELLPNREQYEDIYSSDDEEEEGSDKDEDSSVVEEDPFRALAIEIKTLNRKLRDAAEMRDSAQDRLEILSRNGRSVQKLRPANLEQFLTEFKVERAKLTVERFESHAIIEDLDNQIRIANKKKDRLNGRSALRTKEKRTKERTRNVEKNNRKKQEILREKARVHAERLKFWPKKVFNVVISLDSPSVDDLSKMSVTSKPLGQVSDNPAKINILFSYITYSASWSPRYDLSLNTVTNSAVLDYQAELRNTTSETWRDAKVVLSTSVSSYQGLGDAIPVIIPWHLRLSKLGDATSESGALYSKHEQAQAIKNRQEIPVQAVAPRDHLFGLEKVVDSYNHANPQQPRTNVPWLPTTAQRQSHMSWPQVGQQQLQQQQIQQQQLQQQHQRAMCQPQMQQTQQPHMLQIPQQQPVYGQQPDQSSRRRQRAVTEALFSGSRSGQQELGNSQGHSLALPERLSFERGFYGGPERDGDDEVSLGTAVMDEDTLGGLDPTLLFEESSFEESGLTTTYDVPTVKTLAPTSSTIKHKIARIDFKGVVFSYVVIPKLKPSALLKARLRNASKITLLKGIAGLTLDGSFMGQSTIPRCSAGDMFTLPLGVDPTIAVSYSKPTVRRSQSGIFSKEDCEVFTRTMIITNTKYNTPVEMEVLDQVPVSEDERLRIEIVTPAGLLTGGQSVPAGNDARSSSDASTGNSIFKDGAGKTKEEVKWGSASATAKKSGEVNWAVKINPLQSCKLVLEYETIRPSGEVVFGV